MIPYDYTGQPAFQENATRDYNALTGGANRNALASVRQSLRSQGVGGRQLGATEGMFRENLGRQVADSNLRIGLQDANARENQRRIVDQQRLKEEGINKQQDYTRQMQSLSDKWRKEDFANATTNSVYGKVGGAVGSVVGGIIGGYLGKSPASAAGGAALGGAAGAGIGGAAGEASGGTSMAGSYDPYGYGY